MALNPALQKLISNATNKYSRSSGKRIKPKEGVSRYRILAPSPAQASWVKSDLQFWADCGVHWIKADENGKPLAVVGCESTVNQAPCPVCTAIDEAVKSAIDEESKKLYESWKTKLTVLVNVLDRSKGSSNPDEVQILELTPTTWGKVTGIIQQFAEANEDVLDMNEGLDITITRTGKGLNTEYSVNTAPGKSAPVKPEQMKSTHDLYAHIQQEFFRGEESKALSAIAQITGVSMPRLTSASGARTPTRALTSAAAAVEDSEVADEVDDEALAGLEEEVAEEAPAPVPEKPKAAAKPAAKPAPAPAPAEEDMDDILADLDTI